MENTLELYHRPRDLAEPVVCMDETTKQLTREVIEPLPARAGPPERFDTLYQRNGGATILMMFEPLGGWRRVSVTESKTRLDWAWQVRRLLEEDYPNVAKVHLVMDNLNTHGGASLYEAFEPNEARRLLARLEFHYTPKHGSWLNMAEIELSVLSRQCLDRRIGDGPALIAEIDAWQSQRNNQASMVKWQFTTADARIKLRKLYPSY